MVEGTNIFHLKLLNEITRLLKSENIKDEEAVAYMILFESIKNDIEATKTAFININSKTGFFGEIVNYINLENSKNISFNTVSI